MSALPSALPVALPATLPTVGPAVLAGACVAASAVLLGRWWRHRGGAARGRALAWLQRRGLRSFGLDARSRGLAPLWLAAHAVAVLIATSLAVWATGHWVLAAVVAPACALAPRRWRRARLRRRRAAIERALPAALGFLAGALRAGHSLPSALTVYAAEHRGPLADELAQLLADQRLGVGFDTALQAAALRIDLPDFTLLSVAVRVSREVGGNLSDALTLLARTLRRKLDMEGRIEALTAQGRMQGIVMTLLPVALAAVLYVVQPATALLFETTLGWLIVAVAGALLAAGHVCIRRIVAIDV